MLRGFENAIFRFSTTPAAASLSLGANQTQSSPYSGLHWALGQTSRVANGLYRVVGNVVPECSTEIGKFWSHVLEA